MKTWKMSEKRPNLATRSTGTQRVLKSPTRHFFEGQEVQVINAGVERHTECLISINGKIVNVRKSEITCSNAE